MSEPHTYPLHFVRERTGERLDYLMLREDGTVQKIIVGLDEAGMINARGYLLPKRYHTGADTIKTIKSLGYRVVSESTYHVNNWLRTRRRAIDNTLPQPQLSAQ